MAASRTIGEAVAAEPVVAAVTRTTAHSTEIPFAVGTHPATVGAQGDFTRVAVVGAVASAAIAAVRTTLAVPVREPHIGTACVVGLQHLLHEQKEIAQPPLGDERQKGGQCEGRMSVEKGATVEEGSEPRGLVMSTSLLGGSKDVDGGAVRIDSAKGAG